VIKKMTIGVTACTLLTLGGTSGAQTTSGAAQTTSGDQVTVPFSDPGRPGTVHVNLMSGGVTVRAGSGRDVIVTTEPERDRGDRTNARARAGDRAGRNRDNDRDDQATAGLRRLTQPAGVRIEEENNTVTVSASVMSRSNNVTLQVPAATALVIRTVNGGDVTVEGVNGSIEVNNVNGSINLKDVGGPVIAHATNGRVTATLRQASSGKPLSLTSFNGNVDVTLPGSAKASVKLRSDRGDVYTDFDVKPTPAPASATTPRDDRRNRRRDDDNDKDKGKYRLDMDRSIYGTINGGGPDLELRTFNGNIYLRRAK